MLSLIALGYSSALAALSTQDRAIIPSWQLLVNPGFESGTQGWTASGGTFTTTTTAANVGSGLVAGSWDSSAASQTLTSSAVTIPSGAYGRPAILSCNIQTPSGSATHKIQAWDGTNVLAEATIQSSTQYRASSVMFQMPGSGSIRARLISVASNEPSINVDDCAQQTLQSDVVVPVAQASIVGTINWANTASCSWATTSASFANFSADSDCPTPTVTGALSAPATKIPGFNYNNMPTGDYMFVATGSCNNNSTTGQAALQYSDGTNTFGSTQLSGTSVCSGAVIGRFNYNTSGSRSFQFQGRITAGTLYIDNDNNAESLTITVYRFPSTAETGVRPDVLPASWSGFHSGVSGGCTTTSSTYADTSACTGSLVLNERQNRNFGTVTTIGSSLLGITFTPPRVGRFLVQASVTTAGSIASGMSGRIIETGSSQVIGQAYVQTSTSNIGGMQHVIGILNVTSLSAVSLKWQFATNGGTLTAQTNPIAALDQASWSIVALDQSFPAPLLVGSVTSNSSGLERIERAAVNEFTTCTSSPCTITRQSGSWLTSVTRSSTGNFTLNIASGIFSATPSCSWSVTNAFVCRSTSSGNTSTAIGLDCRNQAGGADDLNTLYVTCMGPR